MCEQHRAIGVERERDLSRFKSAAATAACLDFTDETPAIQGRVNDVLEGEIIEPISANNTPATSSKQWTSDEFKNKPKAKPGSENPVLSVYKVEQKPYERQNPEAEKSAELVKIITQLLRDIKSREQKFRNSKNTREKRKFQGQQILLLKDTLGIKEFLQIRSAEGMAYSCNLIQSKLKSLGIDPAIFPDCLSPRY